MEPPLPTDFEEVQHSTPQVAAVLTVHNRRELTLRCLESVAAQQGINAQISIFLCDDSSTDGTAQAIAEQFRGVTVVPGDGNQFYSGGMRVAWRAAQPSDPDFYWLLNDDTELDETALQRLLQTHTDVHTRREVPLIIVGTTRNPDGGYSYGGVLQHRVRRLRFDLIHPSASPHQADTMNANCVLVPRDVVERVGIIDAAYHHSMGDFDYGLRAGQMGCEVWVAPGTIGTCAPNPGFVPAATGVRSEWQRLRSVRHLPPAEWRTFASRWGGPLWPALWASPYVRRFIRILRAR